MSRGDRLLVAFSGGPDSTALLCSLGRWAERRGLSVHAAHLDHGEGPESAERARHAERIATGLGVTCAVGRRTVFGPAAGGGGDGGSGSGDDGWEAAARRARYEFLETERRHCGARFTVTAHHLDDQAETVALRLLAGSGLGGLAAIRPTGRQARVGEGVGERASALEHVVRPLLGVPRHLLHRALRHCPLPPSRDPGNDDLSRPRNRLRHRVLPALAAEDAAIARRLATLAAAARGAAAAIDRALLVGLAPRFGPADDGGPRSVGVELTALDGLPATLLPAALALLHRLAGARYPPPATARDELTAQIARRLDGGAAVGCDAGEGWRWESRGERIWLRARRRTLPAPFTYTLEVPGTVEIPALSLRLRLRRAPLEHWMLRGDPHRAGLALPLVAGDTVTVRSRRPGDRLQPLGAPGRRRLKEVLIDRRVPRRRRDRLPLLCLGRDGERIAWVPGVTIDDAFRLDDERQPRRRGQARGQRDRGTTVWLAELEPLGSHEPT